MWEEDTRTPEQIARAKQFASAQATKPAQESQSPASSSSNNSKPKEESNPWESSPSSSSSSNKSSSTSSFSSTPLKTSAPVHEASDNPWDMPVVSSSNITPSSSSSSSFGASKDNNNNSRSSSKPSQESNPWATSSSSSSSSSSSQSKPSSSNASSFSPSSNNSATRSKPSEAESDDPWNPSGSSSSPWSSSSFSTATPQAEDVEDKQAAYANRGVFKNETIVVTPLVAETSASNATSSQLEQAKKELSDHIVRAAARSFDELGLSPELLKGVAAMGWVRPSKIQELTLPMMCNSEKYGRKHIIAQAQTGTGKTGAFSLGAISRVNIDDKWPQVMCVSPTRELAQQTYTVVKQLSQFSKIEALLVIPDVAIPSEISAHVLIGTPGSLKGLISRRRIDPKKLKVFVLDEADQLLTIEQSAGQALGGLGQISLDMRKSLAAECSIMLFSATYEEEVAAFATKVVPREGRLSIRLKPEEISLDKVTQYYIKVNDYGGKFNKVSELFNFMTVGQTIIFLERRLTAKKLYEQLTSEGHKVSLLHGKDMETTARDSVMDSFRRSETKVLITTNVLARGIDVSTVTLVINFDLPQRYNNGGLGGRGTLEADRSTYLHRIGRSSRFGREGVAINLVHDDNGMMVLKDFEKFWGIPINAFPDDLQELDSILKSVEKGNKPK